ncbi:MULTISPECIES: hypothetical protein [Halorussus]|uniref:hypothetical protein n=1 Tax=Halorussus TaxID=1070314 RepID=UPI0019667FCD|nr:MULTISPECIES: hypothetical protein [Halorussus]
MHGSFEFHGSNDGIENGFYWSYEARFTRGDLDAIVFLGKRGGDYPEDFKPDDPDIIRFCLYAPTIPSWMGRLCV